MRGAKSRKFASYKGNFGVRTQVRMCAPGFKAAGMWCGRGKRLLRPCLFLKMKGDRMGLSRRAYAAHRKSKGLIGATESAVRKALSTGRIAAESDGTIDPVKADRQWEIATDASQRRSVDSHAAGVEAARATANLGEVRPVPAEAVESVHAATSEVADGLSEGLTFTKARTAEMALKVQRNKILLQRLKGELVDRRAATQHVFDLARKERDHWLQLPARVSAEMAADLGCDAHAMEMALDRVIRHHLSLLSEVKFEIAPDI